MNAHPSPSTPTKEFIFTDITVNSYNITIWRSFPYTYHVRIDDPHHGLNIELSGFLDTEFDDEDNYFCKLIIKDFPFLETHVLHLKHNDDPDLCGSLIVRFQLAILEVLYLLCGKLSCQSMAIKMTPDVFEEFPVYENFCEYCETVVDARGPKKVWSFQTMPQDYDHFIDELDNAKSILIRGFWELQKQNPTIRQYIKRNDLTVF